MSSQCLFFAVVTLVVICDSSRADCVPDCSSGKFCNLDKNQCECPSDTVEEKSRCLQVALSLGSGCEVDEQCTKKLSANARCDNNKCSCKEGTVAIQNQCDTRKLLGDQCAGNEWCKHIPNAACAQNTCDCNQNYIPHPTNKTICLEVATGFGFVCEEDLQCSLSGLGKAYCRDNKCQCEDGHHQVSGFMPKCEENKGVNEECSLGQCYLPLDGDKQNIECKDGTCSCKNNVTPSRDNQRCSGSGGLELSYLTIVSVISLVISRSPM